VTGFSGQWLQLREAADHRSRCGFDRELAMIAASPLHIVDLGCGTGSNLRFLTRKFTHAQHWVCIDNDAELLATLRQQTDPDAGYSLETIRMNLAADITTLLDRCCADPQTLVTGSALLDLVSASWIDAVASTCARSHLPAWFALTYNGRMELSPGHPEDKKLAALVNAHQLNDKGFGPALGPQASAYAREAFLRHGYDVTEAASDWQLDSRDGELLRQLIDGWLHATRDHSGDQSLFNEWYTQRLAQITAGALSVRVGHSDLLAIAPNASGNRQSNLSSIDSVDAEGKSGARKS